LDDPVVLPSNTPKTPDASNAVDGVDINPFAGEQLADEEAIGALEAAFTGTGFVPTHKFQC
jgi:hypothetical protein